VTASDCPGEPRWMWRPHLGTSSSSRRSRRIAPLLSGRDGMTESADASAIPSTSRLGRLYARYSLQLTPPPSAGVTRRSDALAQALERASRAAGREGACVWAHDVELGHGTGLALLATRRCTCSSLYYRHGMVHECGAPDRRPSLKKNQAGSERYPRAVVKCARAAARPHFNCLALDVRACARLLRADARAALHERDFELGQREEAGLCLTPTYTVLRLRLHQGGARRAGRFHHVTFALAAARPSCSGRRLPREWRVHRDGTAQARVQQPSSSTSTSRAATAWRVATPAPPRARADWSRSPGRRRAPQGRLAEAIGLPPTHAAAAGPSGRRGRGGGRRREGIAS
jgi:hypothetical protein